MTPNLVEVLRFSRRKEQREWAAQKVDDLPRKKEVKSLTPPNNARRQLSASGSNRTRNRVSIGVALVWLCCLHLHAAEPASAAT